MKLLTNIGCNLSEVDMHLSIVLLSYRQNLIMLYRAQVEHISLDTANSSSSFLSHFCDTHCQYYFFPLPFLFCSSLPSHACHEWRQTASLAAARMRQQLILGCPPSLLKGRYRVSNSSSWLDTLEISGQGQSSKQVN